MKTNERLYGTKHACQSPKIKEKVKEINLKHVKVENQLGEKIDIEGNTDLKEGENLITIVVYNAKKEELLRHCHQYQIDYVEADINKSYDQVLTSYLIKRSK